MASNIINIGGYVYTDEDLSDGNCYIGNSLTNEELAIDTLEVTAKVSDEVEFADSQGSTFTLSNLDNLVVYNAVVDLYAKLIDDGENNFTTNDGSQFLTQLVKASYKYGDVVNFTHGNSLIGKFYYKNSKRVGINKYELCSVSAVGLLEDTKHYGGMYSDINAGVIISSIMGTIPHSIDEDVYNVPVRGWLPIATGRDNLQQVLFAIGAGIFKDNEGNVSFKFLVIQAETNIPDSRIYIDGSVNNKTPCSMSNVTEHNFYALSETSETTLFSSSVNLLSQLVTFTGPYHSLSSTGLAIESSGVNYAVVSGTGSLAGKGYVDSKKTVKYYTKFDKKENVVSAANATLVSSLNSHNVAKRIATYYSATAIDTIGLVVGDEMPGSQVSFTDSFDSTVSGYIKSMDISISYKLKAETEVVIGFIPTEHGNDE